MARPPVLALRWLETNRYTLAVLAGLLDGLPDAPVRVRIAADPADAAGADLVAWSFASPAAALVEAEIRALRAQSDRPLLLAGGPHASARPEEVAGWGADAVFIGEAEASLPAWLRARAGGRPGPTEIVPPTPFDSLDAFPPFAAGRGLFAPVEIRRGCPGGCAFCQTPRLFPALRERSPRAVREAVRTMRRHGLKRIHFTLSDALLYGSPDGVNPAPEMIEDLLRGVRAEGLLPAYGFFPSEVGPRTLSRHPGLARLLRPLVANREMVIGAQTASPAHLARLRRGHTVEEAEAAVAAAREGGFVPLVDLLFGAPGETDEDRRLTFAWMERLRDRARARFNLHRFRPLPGSPWADLPAEPLDAETLETLRRWRDSGGARGWNPATDQPASRAPSGPAS